MPRGLFAVSSYCCVVLLLWQVVRLWQVCGGSVGESAVKTLNREGGGCISLSTDRLMQGRSGGRQSEGFVGSVFDRQRNIGFPFFIEVKQLFLAIQHRNAFVVYINQHL